MFRRWSWKSAAVGSAVGFWLGGFLCGLLMMLVNLEADDYPFYGLVGTAIVLPVAVGLTVFCVAGVILFILTLLYCLVLWPLFCGAKGRTHDWNERRRATNRMLGLARQRRRDSASEKPDSTRESGT